MSYRTILAVINEQTSSTISALYALALAVSCKSALVLYSSSPQRSSDQTRRGTEHHLDHLFRQADELGVEVSRISETVDLTRLLSKRVTAEKADLVFYPLAPDERYGAVIRQQTVHRLLRAIPVDVVVTRVIQMAKPHPRRILVPLGGVIEQPDRLTAFLFLLADSFQARITLFHRNSAARKGSAAVIPEAILYLQDKLLRKKLPVDIRSGFGHIGKAISLSAITHHHDLIVMGVSRLSILNRILHGNTAADVLSHPPCNTLLFRPCCAASAANCRGDCPATVGELSDDWHVSQTWCQYGLPGQG